ncbi:hypothetical protein GX831_02195 [bacterium]|nr:hypothetical protein [bacterium]
MDSIAGKDMVKISLPIGISRILSEDKLDTVTAPFVSQNYNRFNIKSPQEIFDVLE